MKGDFSRVKREYAVELTEDVYDEFVNLPGVYGLILVYKNKGKIRYVITIHSFDIEQYLAI